MLQRLENQKQENGIIKTLDKDIRVWLGVFYFGNILVTLRVYDCCI